MSKFNFNIDIEDNERQNSLFKSKYNSITQKELYELNQYVVDLGLPSKTLWCKYNLGCDVNLLNTCPENAKTEDWHGNYYMWGELNEIKNKECKFENYKFTKFVSKFKLGLGDIIEKHMIKYNTEDKLTQLQLEDDVAYQSIHIGNYKFHIPSIKQIDELLKYTIKKEIETYTINEKEFKGLGKYGFGCEFISTINGNKLIIPKAGFLCNNEPNSYSDCRIWTSDCNPTIRLYQAYFYGFNPGGSFPYYTDRCNGYVIRPIMDLNLN